jgi:hypothetical protein
MRGLTVEKPLTAKQEAFAQAVADGMTQSDAYRQCYDTKTKSDKSVNEIASQLMANLKISSRVAELKAKLSDEILWTRKEAAEVLRKAINLGLDAESHGKLSDAVKSVEVLNKMTGFEAPQVVEFKGMGEIRLNIVRGGSV